MKNYKIKIRQIKYHPNFSEYILGILQNIGGCSVLLTHPRRKSFREMPDPGIIWNEGTIQIEDSECHRTFKLRTNNDEYYDIKLKTIS